MPFCLTDIMLDKYYNDEFEALLTYGPLGYGKSSYDIQSTAEVYGIINDEVVGENPDGTPAYSDYDAVKPRLKFHPEEVMKYLLDREERDVTMIWDDAGLWLYALDWNHPFIKAFGKYLNVARTDFGSIQFTAPLPTMVMKRVRDMPQVRTIKVIKRDTDDPERRYKPRIAKLYQMWISPDMKRSGVKQTHEDTYNAYLPDDFFAWYKPIRDHYAKMAKMMMKKEMSKMMKDILGSSYQEAVDEADKLKEDRLAEDAEKLVFRADDLAKELIEHIN